MRASDPRRALIRGLAEIEPVLAEGGIAFDELRAGGGRRSIPIA